MSKTGDRIAEFERFLERLGVSGRAFCEHQYRQWIGRVRRTYEALDEKERKVDAEKGERREGV
jgi:hypothetical protein